MLRQAQRERLEGLARAAAQDSSSIGQLLAQIPDETLRLVLHNEIMEQWLRALLVADSSTVAEHLRKHIRREVLPTGEEVRSNLQRYRNVTALFRDGGPDAIGWCFTQTKWADLLQTYGRGLRLQLSWSAAWALDDWMYKVLHLDQGCLDLTGQEPVGGFFLGYPVELDGIRNYADDYIVLDFGMLAYGGQPLSRSAEGNIE